MLRPLTSVAVRDKLVLLLLPFLRQWSFSRKPEQVLDVHLSQGAWHKPSCKILKMTAASLGNLFLCLLTYKGMGSQSICIRRADTACLWPDTHYCTDQWRSQVSASQTGCLCPRPVHTLHGSLYLHRPLQHPADSRGEVHTRQHVHHSESSSNLITLECAKLPDNTFLFSQ